MNKEKFGWGLILLFIGGVLLLDNLNVIDFYWRSVFHLWPVVLIVIGVNLLVPRRGIGPLISITVTVIALAFLAYQGTFPPRHSWWMGNDRGWGTEEPTEGQRHSEPSKGVFTHDYDSTVAEAYLDIKGGAVAYEITGHTDKLFHAEASSVFGSHHLETVTKDTVTHLTFSMKSNKKGSWKLNTGENWANIMLSTHPAWHINLDMGAGSAEFDLTAYNIASLRFKGGAAAFEAKLGMPMKETTILAESGVASIAIEIPKAAACRIVVESGLSSKDFPGFTKQNDGAYVTENYTDTTNKYIINLRGGLSAFTVKRYD